MEKNVFKFILKYSVSDQVLLLILTLLSFPLLYLSLEIPKIIVNEAIGGTAQDFPKIISYPLLNINFEINQIHFLFLLSFIFLALVLLNGGFKFYINVRKGQVGERMLRRLRYQLFDRLLRFPIPYFKKMNQGEVIPIITSEVEPLGGFIGDAFVLPIFQGGTLFVYLGFIFVQDPILGAAAIALYPLQIIFIPKLQKKVNKLSRKRVLAVRRLAGHLHETILGIQDVHANATTRWEKAVATFRLSKIYFIRFDIYRRKFFIKFLNNFIAQLTPFFFYAVGGYLVIVDKLTIGALVAVLAAYKDLAAPWKELLDYYQLKEDIKVKYQQILDQFQPSGITLADPEPDPGTPAPDLRHPITIKQVTIREDDAVLLEDVSLQIPTGQHVALVGNVGNGQEALCYLLAGFIQPQRGQITIGDHLLNDYHPFLLAQKIGYVDHNPHFIGGSVKNLILYGLHQDPLPALPQNRDEERYINEATVSGNLPFMLNQTWINWPALGFADENEAIGSIIALCHLVGLDDDAYEWGLKAIVDVNNHPDFTQKVVDIRKCLRKSLEEHQEKEARSWVEFFALDKFNTNATVAENLLFGTWQHQNNLNIIENPSLLELLKKTDLLVDFLTIGLKVADVMVELFSGLDKIKSRDFLEEYSFIAFDDLPLLQRLLRHAERLDNLTLMNLDDQMALAGLTLKLIPAQHRLGLIDAVLQERILKARHLFVHDPHLVPELADNIIIFDEHQYNPGLTLLDNILFGKIAAGVPRALQKVKKLVHQTLLDMNLYQNVVGIGLDFHTGIGATRLNLGQKQKVALIAVMLKNPDYVVLNQATNALDKGSQLVIQEHILDHFKDRTVVWALTKASQAKEFDQIVLMRHGTIIEQGTYSELASEGTGYYTLSSSE